MSCKPRLVCEFLLRACILLSGLAVCSCATGQVLYQDQEVHIHDLPSLTARTQDPADVLLTSLATVFHDGEICCGKDSALHDSALAADPESLNDVADKLAGRHLLSDGRPIKVTAKYIAADAISTGPLIAMVMNEHAAVIEWNSHLYVLHGVVYRWTASGDPTTGASSKRTVIHKLLLWDTRFSDSERRDIVFDRTTDDLSKLQGLLFLESAAQ